MLQLTVNSFSTVDSTTFVLYKSHFSVCTFDHIPMLKYAVEGLNTVITSSYLVGCSIMFSSIMCQIKPRLAPYRGLILGSPPSPGQRRSTRICGNAGRKRPSVCLANHRAERDSGIKARDCKVLAEHNNLTKNHLIFKVSKLIPNFCFLSNHRGSFPRRGPPESHSLWRIIYFRQILRYSIHMCSSMLSLKVFVYSEWHSTYIQRTKTSDHSSIGRLQQVKDYRKL